MFLALLASAHAELWPYGSFPLGYAVESYPASMSEEDFQAELDAAAAVWVDDCAGSLFVRDEESPEVLFRVGEAPEEAEYGLECEEGQCVVWISPELQLATQDEAYEAGCDESAFPAQELMAHQLGHVLGLGHTVEQGETSTDVSEMESLMYWVLVCMEEVRLTAHDVELLEETYQAAPRLLVEDEPPGSELVLAADQLVTVRVSEEVQRQVSWTLDGQDLGQELEVAVGPLEPGVHGLLAQVSWDNGLCGPQEASLYLTLRVFGDEGTEDTGSRAGEADCGCSSGGYAAPLLLLIPALLIRRERDRTRPSRPPAGRPPRPRR